VKGATSQNRFEETGPRQMRKTARVIAVCLVGGLLGLSALDADHRQAKRCQAMKERRGHAARLEQNALNGRPSQAAIAFGAVGVLASRMTFPSRSMTQTCVSSIETSNPAKYFMALLFTSESRYYRLSGSNRPGCQPPSSSQRPQ
jgi:hypothetical protein